MPTTPEILDGIVSCEVAFNGTTFESVSSDLKSVATKRGANRTEQPAIRYESGTGSVVLKNNDREFDPTNLSGPHVNAGVTQVQPMRPIRLRATWNAVTYDLFRGFIDSWDLDWNGPNWSEVTVPFTDGFKVLASYDRVPLTTPVGEGELSSARITRILDSVVWPAGLRTIATGNSPMQATDLGGSALTECFLTADSEVGEFYIGGNGNVVFRNRHAIFTDSRSKNVQATFGDSGSELRYKNDGLTLVYDHESLANRVQVARAGGVQQIATDIPSVAAYLTKTFNRSDLLLQTDGEALSWAQWILLVSKDPELRFSTMVINPLRDTTNLFPQVLGREIGDRIRILRRPPGGGSAIQRDCFIRGISHSITPSTWLTTWVLQSATDYGNFFTLDDATLGVLGNGVPMVF